MTNTQHTETPWEVYKSANGLYIQTPNRNRIIATIYPTRVVSQHQDMEANARFIVKACNNHDALVEACGAALEFMVALDIQRKVISGLSLQLNEALANLNRDGNK